MRVTRTGLKKVFLPDLVIADIDWTDAFVAAQMIENEQPEIYSYDQDFDRLPEIKRVEPYKV